LTTSATENAVIVWPEGNENRSGGNTFDQQCGSNWQGRGRWLSFFNPLKTIIPMIAAHPAAPSAENLCGPPSINSMTPSPYHSQPQALEAALFRCAPDVHSADPHPGLQWAASASASRTS
ncbi:MAG: hypothetical protein WCD34_17490, partial [Candidatus Acidiferrum sp.]